MLEGFLLRMKQDLGLANGEKHRWAQNDDDPTQRVIREKGKETRLDAESYPMLPRGEHPGQTEPLSLEGRTQEIHADSNEPL